MTTRFDYVKYDESSTQQQGDFKTKFIELSRMVESYNSSRASSLVLTKLEEAYAWIGKMIRDEQIERLGPQSNVPERSNE